MIEDSARRLAMLHLELEKLVGAMEASFRDLAAARGELAKLALDMGADREDADRERP